MRDACGGLVLSVLSVFDAATTFTREKITIITWRLLVTWGGEEPGVLV